MPRFPVADWQAQQVRLTIFPTPDAATRFADWFKADWWQMVTDNQPDEITTNPKQGSGLVQGSFGTGKLILRFGTDRIDWLFVTPENDLGEGIEAAEFPTLGPGMEMIGSFSAAAEKWLRRGDLPPIARIAFGAHLMHREEDRRAGYLRLPNYVPVQVDPESSDFLYQINLPPAQSFTGIEGLQLNRLNKWSVAGFALVALTMAGKVVQAQASPRVFALRLELDINTTPSFAGPIPQERLFEVFGELVGSGCSIATNGVVAP